MNIDELKCVVRDQPQPACWGDACAETGRLVVLDPAMSAKVNLWSFLDGKGFMRHPLAPDDWNYDDFTSDQMIYLLMAARLTNRSFFETIVANLPKMTKPKLPDVHFIACERWHMLGVSAVVQMQINRLPWRWSDAENRTGFWKYWRFESSTDSTVSYLTTLIAIIFLRRLGITWPAKFMNEERYVMKAMAYYNGEPNAAWFTDLIAKAVKPERELT